MTAAAESQNPEWAISFPDGHGATGQLLFQGTPVRGVASLTVIALPSKPVRLLLEIYPRNLDMALSALENVEITVIQEDT